MARNGWNSYQKLVLEKLADHSASLEALNGELRDLRGKDIPLLQIEIAMLKVKAGMWGATAGTIPAVLAVLYIWIENAWK